MNVLLLPMAAFECGGGEGADSSQSLLRHPGPRAPGAKNSWTPDLIRGPASSGATPKISDAPDT